MKIGDLVKLKGAANAGMIGIIIAECNEQRQGTIDILLANGMLCKRIWKQHTEIVNEC